MKSEKKIALPGERIAVIEEFMPYSGSYPYAYEEDGNIYSSVVGIVKKDLSRRLIAVEPVPKCTRLPMYNDVVYGQVMSVIKDTVAVTRILGKEGGTRYEVTVTGLLHISQVSETIIRSIYDAVRIGDYIRAKVISRHGPPYLLTIKGRDLGVILAFCPFCHQPLYRHGTLLQCRNCRLSFKRKISAMYLV